MAKDGSVSVPLFHRSSRPTSKPAGDEAWLGQYIPLHYHCHMLLDADRVESFRKAISHVVKPGNKVLELGGGTGILSWLAAQQGATVQCVERNPQLATAARQFLDKNPGGERVTVIHADAFEYLPPEPVDVVICEMLHVALVREKQTAVLKSFVERYSRRFGGRVPTFLPELSLLAIQPAEQCYNFVGYHAPIPIFQAPSIEQSGTVGLGDPVAYSTIEYDRPHPDIIAWQGSLAINRSGELNALRFITKNVLAVVISEQQAIPWWNQYLVLPLAQPFAVQVGDMLNVSLNYTFGGSIEELTAGMQVQPIAVKLPQVRRKAA